MLNQYASSVLTVDLRAVRENYAILQSKAAGAEVAAVVKANAYGLGVAEITAAFVGQGCRIFFVATLDEALELRAIQPLINIFVFQGVMSGQEEVFIAHNIIPVLNSIYQINIWQQHAVNEQRKLPCILHCDTGMNRLGLKAKKPENWQLDVEKLEIKYLMSHLACADTPYHPMNEEQLAEFQMVAKNFGCKTLSLANSSGIFLGTQYHFNLVRPGIALYGGNPTPHLPNPMKNIIKLTSEILQIQQIDSSATVGYGAQCRLAAGTKIATIAAGYADGYLRSSAGRAVCAVAGVLVPVIGRVSMDLITVDVTTVPEAKLAVGLEVELISEGVPVDVVAANSGTISYEILTSLGRRYKRKYI